MAASAPLAVPASPASSSKRSRSRDSISGNHHHHPHLNASLLSSSQSAPSLIIPDPSSALQHASLDDPTPYPAFLRLKLHQKFSDLESEQRQRAIHALHHGPHHHQPSEWARCTGEAVTRRNRYANVDPYSANRVHLIVPDGHNDYINASPIELTTSKSGTVLRYIATQGPKVDTYSHFWRMVWHETTSPAVVVMLTRTWESDREKCYRYYPESLAQPNLPLNTHDEYADGFIHNLKLLSLTDHANDRAQIRELEMTTIWHLLFGGWPDFLVPEGADRAALVALIETSRAKTNHNLSNPRIVHCSAGVGRSGTFIALDWLLQELDEGSLDDVPDDADPVYGVVDALRRQRTMMVQGEAQLGFIYDVVRERWRARWVERFPEEAKQLGVVAPPSSMPDVEEEDDDDEDDDDDDDDPILHSQAGGDGNGVRAELEAELQDAEMVFERGKT
ncbi:hypothetical protein DM02DRAFT_598605 [Periconia macrospinosa]|uniref:Uncharacterized protein n=1 Tax=Periconia macrospinosa TaxID=97972 RepID=A0A2V1DFD8_9PLEO|nr:hypothetical protein DM02DRAFT_598605 [Periconia macrospinosa]